MSRKETNIFKRKDGRWEARYIHHYEGGKACYRYLYGKSYNEVRQKRLSEQQARSNVDAQPRKSAPDLVSFSENWLASTRTRVKESTYTRYSRILSVYLKPVFKKYTLLDHIQELPEYLLKHGGAKGGELSPKSVTDILCVFKSILKYAQKNGFFYPCNAEFSYPQKGSKRVRIVDEASRIRLENIIFFSESVEARGIMLALFAGLRIGELCGLRWEDIDLENGTLSVRRTVERIADLDADSQRKTKVIVGTPKTGSSERMIPLPQFITEWLQRFRCRQNTYVLTGNAKPMEPHQFYMRYKKFLKRHGFPDMTFHALRHTFATRCVELEFDAKALSEILGHSSVTTTLAVYVHPTLQQKRVQMERLVAKMYS